MSKEPQLGSVGRLRKDQAQREEEIARGIEQAQRDEKIMVEAFKAWGNSDRGRFCLEHLVQRFDLFGRVFLPDANGAVDDVRAGIRDGERAAIRYILELAGLTPTLSGVKVLSNPEP